MKILHITASYKPAYIYGGPIQSVGKLCEAIASEAYGNNLDLEVFTTTANGKTELPVEIKKPINVDGVRVTYFKRITKNHSHFSPALLLKLVKLVRAKRTHKLVVHIHAWWNLVAILSCAIAKWYKVPVLLSPRGMLTAYSQQNRHATFKSLIHRLIGKRLLQYCHVHATSEQEQQDIELIVKPKSITVIYNLVSFPESKTSPEKHENSAPLKLLFLSRIEEKKGLELLFNALASLATPWKLTIAGSGEEKYVESLKQMARQLNLDNRIEWIGQVANQVKFGLMAQHDLLVLTSYNENFANVVIESLSVGTPVLISNRVGLSDYVQKNGFGWVTSLHPEAIQKSLSSAAESDEKKNIIRRDAPLVISADFKDASLVQKYLTLYQNITH